jgi:hypothetical protein
MTEQKKQYLKESLDDIKKLSLKEKISYVYHMVRLEYFLWHDLKLPKTRLFKLWKSFKNKNKTQ